MPWGCLTLRQRRVAHSRPLTGLVLDARQGDACLVVSIPPFAVSPREPLCEPLVAECLGDA